MKKSIMAVALLAATTSAYAANPDGGQLLFGGLVSSNTCIMHVDGGAQDSTIQLETATAKEISDYGEVNLSNLGIKPKIFSISVDCSGAGMDFTNTPNAALKMASIYFSNSKGTLNNDISVHDPAGGVNLAVHEIVSAGTYQQVKINDSTDEHLKLFSPDGKAVFNFAVSYVAQSSSVPVVAGYVKSNAAYTFEYK
ncbi:fimbrial protein [Pseudocitrobacter cyperus]|uniref:Fimbrial protein n=1 Tax=Pseudocitrobacter cyperus TaxID=3112843 RepID=A0ABV0HHM8_9ENTR